MNEKSASDTQDINMSPRAMEIIIANMSDNNKASTMNIGLVMHIPASQGIALHGHYRIILSTNEQVHTNAREYRYKYMQHGHGMYQSTKIVIREHFLTNHS